ncbi:flagellar hook-basal body complex protein FliE [Albirhodobacter sp. R86504]|jgi:flagellar hook-basal body complex protein FliE|uniref:flagellar hook-basal body complex protein FliE n=1 Tax=Albirhodobacter sp. R86504 TaxID=3093848 RepID=UPI00366BD41A
MDLLSSFATQAYTKAREAAKPMPEQSAADLASDFAVDFADTLASGEETAKAAMIGDADPHALVQALAESELAVETAVTVRNKVVEAYQEILRMPV